MNVAIIGSGQLGQAVRRALAARGISAQCHSRSTGFDVLRPDDTTSLGPIDAVVEATDIFTQNPKVARDFFVRSTKAVNAAARAAGASKHILASIVNCEKPQMRGNGYYSAKAEQERVARGENADVVVVRSTLWHEFARQNIERMRLGPLALVPAMTVQPVALDSVAEVIADCVTGDRGGSQHEVAGPEVTTLWRMTRSLPRTKGLAVPLPVPGAAGRAFRDGTLLPAPAVEVVGPGFSDWLAAQSYAAEATS